MFISINCAIFLTFCFLAGCNSKNQVPTTTLEKLEQQLNRYHHAQVIQRGQSLRIVLYRDKFFERHTDRIRQDRLNELALIAEMLKQTGDRLIIITGHSDSVKSERVRLQESDTMARNVAVFFWSKGIPNQRMRVFGYSDKKRIAEEDTPMGSAYNRRVEILVPYTPCLF